MKFQLDVHDYGATGDGITVDTAAIQAAIDACHASGGGTVWIASGTFITGTLFLKSRVFLEVDHSATLHGSSDVADYKHVGESHYGDIERALIAATGESNIGLIGSGTINGNGRAFDSDVRPRCILLDQCTSVTIHDLTLRDSGSWMLHLNRCREVSVRGLTIRSRVQMYNDAIDVVSSSFVRISDCDIECGDDAIALKCFEAEPVENVVVTNCLIKSDWAAFRFGPESQGSFRNIAVSNCVIRETWGTGIKLQMVQGARMSDISFSNIVMDKVTGPFMFRLGGWSEGPFAPEENPTWREGVLERVSVSDVTATVTDYTDRPNDNWEDEKYSAITITGVPGLRIRDIEFSNVNITFPGGGTSEHASRTVLPDLTEYYPEYLMFGVPPAYALYMAHVDDVRFRDVRFRLASADARPAIVLSDVQDLSIEGGRIDVDASADSLMRVVDSSGVTCSRTVVPENRAADIQVSGNSSAIEFNGRSRT